MLAQASGKSTYEAAAQLLVLAKKIPEFSGEVNRLIQEYASMRRPSMKREFQKAGLIR